MELNDDLVRAASAGDQDSFRSIHAVLSPRVLGYLRARGVEDPEAVTSEVFLTVYRRLGTLTGGAGGLRSLVFSIAHARWVDQVRHKARWPEELPYEQAYDARTEPSAERVAVESLEGRRAVGLLERLNEDQRTVVMLRIIGDLTLQETADALGRTVASVKQLQRRGLGNLKDLMSAGGVP